MEESEDSDENRIVEKFLEQNDKDETYKKFINKIEMESRVNHEESNITNEEEIDSMIKNYKDGFHITSSTSNRKYDKIMSEYLSGNWQHFFNIWNTSFLKEIRELIEYKIMTLKLRVHFAILPIRIVQLHQHINCASNGSEEITQILENAADNFNTVDDEEDVEGQHSKLTVDSMKQLEDFLNSCDGEKLAEKLKDSFFTTLFALPYIDNPQEDDSMKKIFNFSWLQELTTDLKKFISHYLKPELNICDHKPSFELKESESLSRMRSFPPKNSFYNTADNHKSRLTENNNESTMCDRIIHSTVKNKEIEDWIAQQQNIIEDNNFCTKSTQTRISSIKTGSGFSLISEPHHLASIVTPTINSVPNKQSISYNDELTTTKSRLFSVYKHYKKLKLRFHKLHEDYQKMNEIAETLTIALEDSVRGQRVNLDMILRSCMKIFPDRFNRHLQTDSEDTSVDLKEDLSNRTLTTEAKQNAASNTPVPPKLLNYKKIKLDLKSANIKTKLLLLQALRQKLTMDHSVHRDETIQEYTKNDVLGLHGNSLETDETYILPYILQPFNLHISINFMQQTTARFLNALASLSCGRMYLTSGPIVLNAIIKYLDSYNNEASDVVTLDMLLATLQKMSLRKQQRYYMIEANLVEWLIYHLSNENFRMGSYRLEYTCALLMNLSLQSASWSRAAKIAPLFASTMTSLLSTDCISILPYINGILQNFLLNNDINEEAKKLHLAEILEYHCFRSNKELKNHFSHTLKIHKRESDEYLSDCDEFPDEDDEIFDYLEKELEENDPIRSGIGGLCGENLLAIRYAVPAFFSEPTNFDKQESDDLYNKYANNLSTRESKAVRLSASTAFVIGDSKAETSEKQSGSKAVNTSKKATPSNQKEAKSWNKEEDEAFSAKPRLKRSPPCSPRLDTGRETRTEFKEK